MPRSFVFLAILLVIIVAAMFYLASIDVEREPQPVEKPVIGGELG